MCSHLPNGTGILREQSIRREQWNPLYRCLGNENAIERILMNRRQAVDRNHMVADHGQLAVAVVQ